MKHLLPKLRCWLIHRLGGFTVQRIANRTVRVTTLPADPIRVSVTCCADYEYMKEVGAQLFSRRIKKELAARLVDQLLADDFVLLESKEDRMRNMVYYRADVSLIPANTIAKADAWGFGRGEAVAHDGYFGEPVIYDEVTKGRF